MAIFYLNGTLDRDAKLIQGEPVFVEVRQLTSTPAKLYMRINGVEFYRDVDGKGELSFWTAVPRLAPTGPVTITARTESASGIGSTYNRQTTILAQLRPDEHNTGSRIRVADLNEHPGGLVNTPTDFFGKLFTAPVVPKARTTFTDCRLQFTGNSGGTMINNAAPIELAYCDLDARGSGGIKYALGASNVKADHIRIQGAMDGVRANTNVELDNTLIHNLVRSGDYHPDCIQTTNANGVTVRNCTLDAREAVWNATLGIYELTGGYGNAAIQYGGETRDLATNEPGVVDFLVEDTYLRGGNYTVNARTDAAPGPITMRDCVFYVERNPDGSVVKVFNAGKGVYEGASPRFGSLVRPKPTVMPGWLVENCVEQDGRPITQRYW